MSEAANCIATQEAGADGRCGGSVAEIFIRRYSADDGARGRAKHPVHTDASTVSVSVELSHPDAFGGGLWLQGEAGDVLAQTSAQGGAFYHPGNVSHFVDVTRGSRWSLVLFFYASCTEQVRHAASAAVRAGRRVASGIAPAPSGAALGGDRTHEALSARLACGGQGQRRCLRRSEGHSSSVVPLWLSTAWLEAPAETPAVGSSALACAAGTEWSQGRCVACPPGRFAPPPASGRPTAAAPLAAQRCRPCRAGFMAPAGSAVCVGDG